MKIFAGKKNLVILSNMVFLCAGLFRTRIFQMKAKCVINLCSIGRKEKKKGNKCKQVKKRRLTYTNARVV